MQAGQTLVLVDGSSLAYRSFYALLTSGLRRSDGMATWAVLGFLNSLFDLVEQLKPDGLAISFDMEGPTFRHETFKDYKGTRQEMPDDLSVQWPLIKETVGLLNVPLYEIPGFEADDVIGTVAKQAQKRGIKVQIFTGDYDAFQLVDDESDGIKVLVPVQKRHEIIVYNRQLVFEKLGVWPEQVVDYKGLCGDKSDNIPGVRGIGEVTAVKLLTSYKTMEGIYEHIEEIKGALKQKLIDGRESAFASKGLATMRTDAPLEFDFEHCQLQMPKVEELQQFLLTMEFKQMVTRLPKILPRFGDTGQIPALTVAMMPDSGGDLPGSSYGDKEPARAGGGTKSGASTAVLEAEPLVKITGKPEPRVVSTEQTLVALIHEIEKFPAFSITLEVSDTNIFDGEVVGYALAWTSGLRLNDANRLELAPDYNADTWQVQTAYIPVRHSGSSSNLTSAGVQAALKPLFQNQSKATVVFNSKTTLNAMSIGGEGTAEVNFDPMLASYIIDPDAKHSLKDQAERILGYSTVRTQEQPASGRKQLTINFAEVDKVSSCAADDARMALELARYYVDQLDHDQQDLLYDIDLPMAAVLARMEQNGVAIDVPYLNILSAELSTEIARLESEIYELAGHGFNIGSPQQLQKVLFEELGLKSKAKTKTGYSTDASVLEALRTEHPIVGKILEYRQLAKLRSTYVDALPPQVSTRDNRIHGDFNMTATSTGRLSSSNPNLQNIPIKTEAGRKIRRAFVPGAPDSVLLSADYSQIELRLLGHMSGDATLQDAFEKDQDIHSRTASEVFEVPIDQVTSDQRRVGKTLNFALVYQQGPMATAQSLGITTKEASAFIDKYFTRYAKVRPHMAKTINDARQIGYVQTLWGRRRCFTHLNDRNDMVRKQDERAAVNAPLQGSASDLMRLAMIRLDKELRERKMTSKLILQVHDELVLEVPNCELEEAKQVLRDSMLMDQPLKVPLRVDVGVGDNWMDAH